MPFRLAWLTDLHFDFVADERFDQLCAEIADASPDALAITGDVSQAPKVLDDLDRLADRLGAPVHAVFGNHDYYAGSFQDVHQRARDHSLASPRARWLPATGPALLTPQWAIAGDDGWPDARVGDYAGSEVLMNDFFLIQEFRERWLATGDEPDGPRAKADRLELLRQLGDEAANRARDQLEKAFEMAPNVVFLTHVPPFRESAIHEGGVSSETWLPHMVCGAMGGALRDAAAQRPGSALLVLCGHTHGEGRFQAAPNLLVRTGGAAYREPRLGDLILLD